MSKINEMRQARAKLIRQAREIMERAEKEKRARNADEDAQWARINEEIDALGRRIEDEERLQRLESEIAAVPAPAIVPPSGEERGGRVDSKEQRAAFWRLMRGDRVPADELRTLNITTDANGGYTVPDEWFRQIVMKQEEFNFVRSIATILPTVSGDMNITVESDAGEATWTAESGAYTEDDATFARVTLGAHKLARIQKVSEEFLQDSFVAVESYLADAFGRSFGKAEEKAFLTGSGTGQPTGVVAGTTQTVPAAAGAISSDNILELAYAVKRPYRANGVYVMHDSTALAVRLLKDANDQYLWRPGLAAGEPDTINNRPVYTSDAMDEIGAGNTSIVFGDFQYYWIANRSTPTMQRLNELYAANGQVGFKMFQRVDGKVVLAEAFAKLVHAES